MEQNKKEVNMLLALDALMDNWDDHLQDKALDNNFPYIFSKAFIFLKKGAELYRKDDYFHEPPADFTEEEIAILKFGCEQVLEGRGITAEFPFINLDVMSFYALFKMFHYEYDSRKTNYSYTLDEKGGILDQIFFVHIVDGTKISYFNFLAR